MFFFLFFFTLFFSIETRPGRARSSSSLYTHRTMQLPSVTSASEAVCETCLHSECTHPDDDDDDEDLVEMQDS